MIYLFQFEDGTIKQDTEGPTDVDRLSVQEGVLSVYRIKWLEDVEVVHELDIPPGHEDTWVEVPQAEVEMTHGESWHS